MSGEKEKVSQLFVDTNDPLEEALDELEFEMLWEDLQQQFSRTVTLLAWVIRQRHNPLNLRMASNRPQDIWIVKDPLLRLLSFQDPDIFQLAKIESAEELSSIEQESELDPWLVTDFAAKLLKSEPPARRGKGGDHVARDLFIIAAIYFGEELGRFGKQKNFGGESIVERIGEFSYSGRTASEGMADVLNSHPLLENMPDAIPSADAINAVWKNRDARLGSAKISWNALSELFSECIWVGSKE